MVWILAWRLLLSLARLDMLMSGAGLGVEVDQEHCGYLILKVQLGAG